MNFRDLALGVLIDLLPASMVDVKLSESRASCEFLVRHLKLNAAQWVVACDVGGSTLNTALCVTKEHGGVVTPKVFMIAYDHSSSALDAVVGVDGELKKLLLGFQDRTGIRNLDSGERLDNLPYTDQWRNFRHAFRDDDDFIFNVDTAPCHEGFTLPEGFQIRGKTVTILR